MTYAGTSLAGMALLKEVAGTGAVAVTLPKSKAPAFAAHIADKGLTVHVPLATLTAYAVEKGLA